nr:phosphotransferase family protein [Salinibacillus kushneri]
MEKRNGVVIDDKLPNQFEDTENTCQQISEAVIQSLVQLQKVDYQKEHLESIGKPDGYLSRQVYGWIKRHERSKTEEIKYIDSVEKWLMDHIPSNEEVTIVHNDFKLNNMMFDPQNPDTVIGVFDWELATIGDPLADLGSALVYWIEKDDPPLGITSVTDKPGFYSRRALLERYTQLTGRDVSNINFYLTLGFYKLAGILQQLYYRWKIGEVKDDRFAFLNVGVANLIARAEDAKNNKLL